jgi:uncharacterized membrane protein required for colicin V production
MNWLDMVAVLTIVVVVGLEGWRKFGKSLYDTIGIVLSVHIAHLAQAGLASMVKFSAAPDTNQAVSFGIAFGVLVALTVVGSTYLYRVTLLALPDAFEGFGGALLGLVSGIVIGHAVVWAVYTANGGGVDTNPYLHTVAVQQFVNWDAYHQAMFELKHLGE